jgi:membrane protease subunit (stomatin/prohibitin family)
MSDAMGMGLGLGFGMMMPTIIARSYQWPSAWPTGYAPAAGYGQPALPPALPAAPEPRFCGHCGGGLIPQARFCGHCGQFVVR